MIDSKKGSLGSPSPRISITRRSPSASPISINLYHVPWGEITAASAVVTMLLIIPVLFFRHIIEG